MAQDRKNLWLFAGAGVAALLVGNSLARRARRFDFRNRTVLITGGSRGLGLVLARQFVGEGARVAICARDADELERARQDLHGRGGEVLALPCDVTQQEEVQDLVRVVRQQFGPIDVLVNNAGVIEVGPQEVMTVGDYQESMATHFWAPLYTTLAVLPEMQQRRQGRIVNISSIGGKISVPHLLPYNAGKFALAGFSEGLRTEVLKDGVYVTTVCPGLMRTGSPRNATFKGRHRAEYAWFSISDALPGLSMNVERAAQQVLRACRYGDAEIVLGLPAKVAITINGLMPGIVSTALGIANRLLPAPGGIGSGRARGYESYSAVSPSWLTALNEQAARRNNEVA